MNVCRADKVLLSGCAAMLGSAAILGPTAAGLGIPAALFAALIADGVFRPSSSTFYKTISRGPRSSNRVALTFDDGPDPEITPQVLDVLRRHQARATFFVIGRHLERFMDVAKRAVQEGHELGNHSWQHGYMHHAYPIPRQVDDIEACEALIRSLTGASERAAYRPPVGLKSPRFGRTAEHLGLKVVAWSVHSRDTMDKNPARIARRVVDAARPGDIILMHDGHQNLGAHRPQCPAALPLILEGLNRRGLTPVTVAELLA